MLYNFDPILPFEYADNLENGVLSDEEADYQGDIESDAGSNFAGMTTDPVFSKIVKLENQCKEIFNKANKSIKKAQKHQAKCYNRQVKGKPFEIGCKVLKCNVKDESHKSKFRHKFTGTYLVIDRGPSNLCYLHDHFSYKLTRGVPASHLVHFYENQKYTMTAPNSEKEPTEIYSDDMGVSQGQSGQSDKDTCQRVETNQCNQLMSTPKKSGKPIPSQILIISSKEMPLSSDDSSTIDVATETVPSPINPWGDMNVKNIPIEIVDCFSDKEDEIGVTDVSRGPKILFNPLNDEGQQVAAMKFNLVISAASYPVKFSGVGKPCCSPPMITISAKGNGAFLFNALSMFLTGRDTYNAIIRHVVYNYILNPVKYKCLQAYIPSRFKSGNDYVQSSNMHSFTTWGTEVEIIAMAQISGFDIYVYTKNGWLRYSHCIDNGEDEKSEKAIYISNASGCHFDPVFDS